MPALTDRTVTVRLGILFFSLYLLTAGGHYGGDGFWSYLTAQSLVLDGDLTLGDRPFLVEEMQNQYAATQGDGTVSASGRRYSKYGLGLPLVEVPFYAAGHLISKRLPGIPTDYLTLFATSMTNVLICTLWVLTFFHMARALGYQRSTGLWLTSIFGLGSMVFPYAGYGFSEPLVGLALLGATAGFLRYKQEQTPGALAVASACVAFAALTKLYALITLPIFLFYIWPTFKIQTPRRLTQAALSLFLPLALCLILIGWHNCIRYGSIFKTGYHLDRLSEHGGYHGLWLSQIFTAAYGYLFSTGRGLIFFLPVVLLAPMAFRAFKHACPAEASLFLGLIGVHFFPLLLMIDWHGGSSWGPRYLLPVIPFLILPIGLLIEISERGRLTTLYLGIAGLLAQVPGALMNPHLFVKFILNNRIGNLIFYPGHPGDLLFSPYLSPILGGYSQLASALTGLLTGQSLNYTISSGVERKIVASLASYDLVDTWWANAVRTGLLGSAATAGILLIGIALLAVSVFSAWTLIQSARPSGRAEHPAGAIQ